MSKLHELLAAEKDVKNKASKILIEAKDTFGKKHDHFTGNLKEYNAFNEEEKFEEAALSESRQMVTTVNKKFNYVLEKMVDAIDIAYQKDLSNRIAKADIIVNGITIATDVPATTLLYLEDQIREIRDMTNLIPTLQPGLKWIKDSDLGDDVYKTETPDTKLRTKKQTVHKVIVPPTDRHPAQVATETQDIAVGKYVETKYSGMITPAEKSRLMERIDNLLSAIKKARARANECDVPDGTVAQKLFNYITE
jgi:hypothetical protein